MALPKRPVSSDVAAATMGLSVSFWHDVSSWRTRRPAAGPRRASPRLREVRTQNQIAFDAWQDLSDAQRMGWTAISRRRRHKTIAGSWSMEPQLEYTRRCIRVLDAGRPLLAQPPAVEAVPDLVTVEALRIGWAGECKLFWDPVVGWGSDGLVMVGLSRALNLSGPLPPVGRIAIIGYADASAGVFSFTVPVHESRYVGWRPVSAFGGCPSAWRVQFLAGW